MAGRKEGQKAVDLRKFLTTLVEVHQEGGTLSMVADQLGITPAAVSSRIKTLKDKGVKGLPVFERGVRGNVAEAASDILAELLGDESDSDSDEDEDEDSDEDE